MAQLGNLITNGTARFLSKVYANDSINAPSFIENGSKLSDKYQPKGSYALSSHSHTTVNGHTVNADVPSGAKFTDTWRDIQNNLTSTSTTDSLSAYQGKVLNDKIDTINSNLYIYERLQNGKIIADNYDVIRIMFQDLAVDSGYFIQDFILNDSGSTYVEGSIRYANNSIYVL